MSFDLEDFLPYRLYQAAERTSAAFSRCYREDFAINRTQWRVLFNLMQYAPITIGDLSRRSGIEKTMVSRAVAALEERGWVARSEVEADRRRQNLVLTNEGRSAAEALRERAAVFNAALVEQLGEEGADRLLGQLVALERDEVASD